mmetsp:Transcript_52539/g.86345  ORF Transcript_52539/g.86345 Transcript_52539/m.86345 type:complete len:106 (+) Transcript_52539:1777-2094(+)
MRVAAGCLDLKYGPRLDSDQGNIECTATQIENQYLFSLLHILAVQAIGQGGGRGLIDDAGNLQTGQLPCQFCGRALGVVEVGRHCDDGALDFVSQIGFRRRLHLL